MNRISIVNRRSFRFDYQDGLKFFKVKVVEINSTGHVSFRYEDLVTGREFDILHTFFSPLENGEKEPILKGDGNYEILVVAINETMEEIAGTNSCLEFHLLEGWLLAGKKVGDTLNIPTESGEPGIKLPEVPQETPPTHSEPEKVAEQSVLPEQPEKQKTTSPETEEKKEGGNVNRISPISFDSRLLSFHVLENANAKTFAIRVFRKEDPSGHIFGSEKLQKQLDQQGNPVAVNSYRLTSLTLTREVTAGEFRAILLAFDEKGAPIEGVECSFNLNERQVEIIRDELAAKKQTEIAVIENLMIVDVGNDKGKIVRWTALPSNKYLVRIVRLNDRTHVMMGKDQTLDVNRVPFDGLTNGTTYKVSVAGYNREGHRGPWTSLIFHVEDERMIPGYAPQRKQEAQLPLPPTPAPQAKEQGKKEEPAPTPPPQPDLAVKKLEEELRKEREENKGLKETLEKKVEQLLNTAQQEQATFEQTMKERIEQERLALEKRLEEERQQYQQRETTRQAHFEQTVKRLQEEKAEVERKAATITNEAALPAPQPATPPVTQPQPAVTTTTSTTPPSPSTPSTKTAGENGNGNSKPSGPTSIPTATQWKPWEKMVAGLLVTLLLLGALALGIWLVKKPTAAAIDPNQVVLQNQLAEHQALIKKLLESSNTMARGQAPVTPPSSSPTDIQVSSEKINVRPTDPSRWANKGGKVSHSGNTTTAHTIIGVVNNGEIKNSTIRVMSSEVWTSEWTPTLPTVTCGKEVNAGTNEFVIGPREVQCIMVPIGWLVQPCLEDLINIDMMCGDDAVARTYLPGTKGQPPLKGNQMRFRLKSHISQEVTVRFRVIAP